MFLLHILFIVAICAEAVTGALAAGRRHMDWLGVAVVGCVAALGGGTLRDLLLGNYPMLWIGDPSFLLIALGSAMLTIAIAPAVLKLRMAFLLLDALGLVVLTVVGCSVAQSVDMPVLIVIVAGIITGCAGGVLRDILCNEVPLLFSGELYATVSLVTAGLYMAGLAVGWPVELVTAGAVATGFALRVLAIVFNIRMPRVVFTDDLR